MTVVDRFSMAAACVVRVCVICVHFVMIAWVMLASLGAVMSFTVLCSYGETAGSRSSQRSVKLRRSLANVREHRGQQRGDVLVGERIENMLPVASTGDELLGAEYAEALRDGREIVAGKRSNLTYAKLSLQEQFEQPQS